MKMFKKVIRQNKSAAADKAAGWIANSILRVQNRFANVLGKMSASWKTRQQLIFLNLICVVLGGLSVLAIIKPFDKNAKNIVSKPTAIKSPRMLPGEERNLVLITDDEIMQVHVFKHSLDSLSRTDSGKGKVKDMLARRPGLMDSLEMVEQLYYSQKK